MSKFNNLIHRSIWATPISRHEALKISKLELFLPIVVIPDMRYRVFLSHFRHAWNSLSGISLRVFQIDTCHRHAGMTKVCRILADRWGALRRQPQWSWTMRLLT